MLRWIRSTLRRFRREEKGSSLVEMTIITPLMIGLSAGVFEFGQLFYQKLLIEAGLRDGGRYAARCNPDPDFFPSGLPGGLTCEQVARNIAATASWNGSGPPRVAGWAPADVQVNLAHLVLPTVDENGNQLYRGEGTVRVVRIETSFEFEGTTLLAYLTATVGVGPITLAASHEERVIRW